MYILAYQLLNTMIYDLSMWFLCKTNPIKYLQDKQHLRHQQEATGKEGYEAERKGMYGTTLGIGLVLIGTNELLTLLSGGRESSGDASGCLRCLVGL
jgi:hypothetical protein